MLNELVEVKSFGKVSPKQGSNSRLPYSHQKKAMESLDIINKSNTFSTLVVLPTGGGKTYTASMWLLKNALNNKKKVLWLAHRQMLLDQAAESFQKFAYSELIPHIDNFSYRIISGAPNHDRTIDIKHNDQLLIVGKDSIGRNLDRLDIWLDGEDEIFLVVDEAHHSTAKTYRRIISYVQERVPNVKLIGLTATPFRTAEKEQGLLAKIYSDGVKSGVAVHGDIGITYQIGLKELINKQILAKPVFESYYTDEKYGETMGVSAWESIQNLDVLPENIAGQMAKSAARNKMIVDTYVAKKDEYGQTIVFAVNIVHAVQLNALFKKAGISSAYIVSDTKDMITGIKISREDNEKSIESYRAGEIQVLINVNILTEGIDLPKTKSVFLARPTVSTILMTQMVGRALRGVSAGGTSSAYIVSFVDNWNEHIAWVNPESLFEGNNEFTEVTAERIKRVLTWIAISKIEEFASVLDDSIDSADLERVPFVQRIPIGMYAFTYLVDDGADLSYQVMVYNSTLEAYENLMAELPSLFESYGLDEEYLSDEILSELESHCRDTFFCGEMIPPYQPEDVISILKYFAQYDSAPPFYTFDQIDSSRLDVAKIARHIWDEEMSPRKKAEYLDSLWDSEDDNLLRLFFGRKLYFLRQLDIELVKIHNPDAYTKESNIRYGERPLKDMTLWQIRDINPEYEKLLRDQVFENSKTADGQYHCDGCGLTSKNRLPFHVDHIVPMNNGGKSEPENLQILCRSCNIHKGDK